ncbi:Receptor-type tyrosine-protein phosphatase kappa, partial [Paragonimus heterotremus]
TDIKSASLDVWTLSVPFASSVRLKIGDLGIASEGNDSVTVNFPDIKGYDGGPLNGFYLAVVENVDFNTIPALDSYDIRRLATHGQNSALISNGRIVYQSFTWPSEPILIGSGIVESEASNIQTRLFDPVSLENPYLKPNTTYIFYAVIQSIVDQWVEEMVADTMVLRTWNPTKKGVMIVEQNRGPNAVLIGGILGALLIVIAFGLLGWLFYCCCVGRFPYGKCGSYAVKTLSCQNYSGSVHKKNTDECAYLLPDSYAWWSVPLDFREPRYLIIDPEKGPSSTLVGTWSKKDLADTFAREFASIPLGFKYLHNRGELKENRSKNRNQAVLPYDHNRVVLKRPMDSVETDYINASFVDGYLRRRAYITAQSPFDTPTACDFWLMVFQRNVSQIVMLTNLVEDGSLKCCQYWPDPSPRTGTKHNSPSDTQPSSSAHQFGDLIVQASDRVGYAHFTVRQFDVTELSTGNVHHVVQYHFHSWASPEDQVVITKTQVMDAHPLDSNTSCFAVCADEVENGLKEKLFTSGHSPSASSAPFDRLAFIEFYYRVKTASRPEDGPVVVHCGTGLSRTGLYIAFDTLLQQATHERVVSVARLCGSLNKARANMFSSTQTYALLYDLLFEALLAGHSIVDLDVLSTYRVLNQKNTKLGRSFQWEQWSVLHHYTPLPDPDTDLRVALSAGNAKRNRYGKELDLLPTERWRPHLSNRPAEPDYGGYINALFLDGAALRDDLILTQTPMSTTVDDFWQLVDEEKVTCIVDMEPFGYGIKSAIRYWPLRTGELNHEPLFEGSSDEERDRVDTLSDAEDAAAARGPWWPFVGGYLQICQVGPLVPVLLDPVARKRSSSHGIYRRRLLLRRTPQTNSSNSQSNSEGKSKRREVLIFHFAGDWNTAAQVPESRVSIVRLLEGIRLERGTGPLLIHCLDGATRSGLLAVCHVLAERMTRDHYVDLFHVVKAVKIRRRAVINSPEQLRFVYRLLAQWIKQTLSEPLAEWTARHMGDSSAEWQWPQLVGHLPPHTRVGVFSKSQLPALVTDLSSAAATRTDGEVPGDRQSHGMLNASNSTEPSCSTNTTSACTLYYYFQDELLNQRSTYSLNSKLNTRVDAAGDLNQMGSWSTVALNRAQY